MDKGIDSKNKNKELIMAYRDEDKATKWRALLDEQAKSKKSAAAFCQERALSIHVFYYWRKRLRSEGSGNDGQGCFVQVGGEEDADGGVSVCVGEWRIELSVNFSEATLLRTLKALRRC